jgi:hypothetical protein
MRCQRQPEDSKGQHRGRAGKGMREDGVEAARRQKGASRGGAGKAMREIGADRGSEKAERGRA